MRNKFVRRKLIRRNFKSGERQIKELPKEQIQNIADISDV